MTQLVNVYRFDQNGYFCGVCQAMNDANGNLLLPADCVTFAPTEKKGYWNVLNTDKTKWKQEKKPTTAKECVGIKVEHSDLTNRAHELRALFESLTKGSTEYRTVRDDNLTLSVEEIPAPTEAEIALQEAEEVVQEQESQIKALQDAMTLAMLSGDQEQIAELQATYAALNSEE